MQVQKFFREKISGPEWRSNTYTYRGDCSTGKIYLLYQLPWQIHVHACLIIRTVSRNQPETEPCIRQWWHVPEFVVQHSSYIWTNQVYSVKHVFYIKPWTRKFLMVTVEWCVPPKPIGECMPLSSSMLQSTAFEFGITCWPPLHQVG